MKTEQTDFWQGEFGAEYTERNTYTVEELDKFYLETWGVSRTEMNKQALAGLGIASVLEVGCNIGNQLRCLQQAGYRNLYGIELQSYAVEKAKQLTRGIQLIQGSAFDVPFKDAYFDLVFTSGVLIHIAPHDLEAVMKEMVRVSRKYIWGFEYYADVTEEIHYRGNGNKMWKSDYAALFLSRFSELKLVSKTFYPYVKDSNVDCMYLLEKQG